MDSTRQDKWLKQTTANPHPPRNHREQEQGQDHTTPVGAPGESAPTTNHQQSCEVPPSIETTTAAQQTFSDEGGELTQGQKTKPRARRLGITVA